MATQTQGTPATPESIAELVRDNRIVLFMKGSRHFPQCGFSATVVGILDQLVTGYKTVNVLTEPGMRDGIKAFSNWPTIPQLYVDGKFVGGCDIVRDMHASGELAQVLGAPAPAPPEPPALEVSDTAAAAFKGAIGSPSDVCRVQITADFQHELFIDERQAGDLTVEVKGVTFAFDGASARRANGLSLDFVQGDAGGFKIDNPNAPPSVKPLSAKSLKGMMDRGEKFELLDVRTAEERQIARIESARHLDDEGIRHVESLPKDTTLVFQCHHGMRSRAAAERFLSQGFKRVFNLEGGIEAWSRDVDSKVPRY
jgi:monothiol glutaredoxin